MANLPFVTVIVPCRNEEKYIGRCLDSIISCDYPKDYLEVLVIDGMSEDKTVEIIKSYTAKYPFIRYIENAKKIVSASLNLGIKMSRGEVIIRMDAHCIYKDNYISQCVKSLLGFNVHNVGGICVTLPGSDSIVAKAIAIALSHPFGVGNAYFRIGIKEPRYVDTVPFGCYKKTVFDRIGLFDEELIRNQDDEFNFRLLKHGGKILIVPDIVSYYFARDSLKKLSRMYYQYGYFKPLVMKKIKRVFTLRQLVAPLFIFSLISSGLLSLAFKPFLWIFVIIISLYFISNFFSSLLSLRSTPTNLVIMLPVIFSTIHFSYGLGYLKGLIDFFLLSSFKSKKIKNPRLSR